MSDPSWPQHDPKAPCRLTYRDGHTNKPVERRYLTTRDALAVAFNYSAAEEAQVYDETGAPLDMDAEFTRWSSGLHIQ